MDSDGSSTAGRGDVCGGSADHGKRIVLVAAEQDGAGIGRIRLQRNVPHWHLQTAMGRGRVSGVERLSGTVACESRDEARVVAAVSGDFFQMAHRPYPGAVSGVMVRGSELIATPRGRPGFYLLADGRPCIEVADTSGTVSMGNAVWPVGPINTPYQGAQDEVQLFTAGGGWELTEGCVVVAIEGGPLRTKGSWTGTGGSFSRMRSSPRSTARVSVARRCRRGCWR